ncbi:Hint domain-containing protein [Methylobacterium oryzihabitans]|uniref:Hedgehog/Intein (Hint) domain-containing protein n=1 Tax=Methylobacterium oryzihabitans TaxID=2499852 RepID=A0A437P3J3_9HYPH|nr:Hint domain-containing protein [Methylobacterium oryzihabitans]RVU16815.1 hypothetical protein EOE48_15215 [Methylobacterium oryzihabitans]
MSITRASTNPDGSQSDGSASGASISGDGTLVAFQSQASDLVAPAAAPLTLGVYVKNLTTGAVTRASELGDGTPIDSFNVAPSLAADGSAVAFRSNLGIPGGSAQAVVKTLGSGAFTIASAAADGTRGNQDTSDVSLSGDGRTVAFASRSTNLLPNDTNVSSDVFVRDLITGTLTRVSTAADGTQADAGSVLASMSVDGRHVAFQSDATNLVAGDTNGVTDVYVKNLTTGAITRASTAADGSQGNGVSTGASLSRDGNLVAFVSRADNLVAGDTNLGADVFVKNLTTGAITRVSTASDGTQSSGDATGIARISADGTKVAFTSFADNLVPGDTNLSTDVFVKDLTTGTLTRVSTAADGTQSNGANFVSPTLSSDGSRVAFDSRATNLVPNDTNSVDDVFVADVICFATGTRLRTARGEVAVEELRVGDRAVTVGGATRPVRWIGARTLDGGGRPLAFSQQPVRIRAGAFGDGLPVRDLLLSPGHPVLVGDHLVPVMSLVNGTSLARMPVGAVTYWHVELDAHDILLAEGLPAESYLDLGSRPWFAGSDAPLHDPEFVPAQAPGRCRPVAVDGPVVEAERRRLDAMFAADLAGACAWDESGDLPWLTA